MSGSKSSRSLRLLFMLFSLAFNDGNALHAHDLQSRSLRRAAPLTFNRASKYVCQIFTLVTI